jgi:ubiquinone/menaquinone biosynthesis C-methylase UbiE
VPVEVRDGVAEWLPAADGAFDAAVLSLMLCSVADQRAALAEVRRVVRADLAARVGDGDPGPLMPPRDGENVKPA